jgi:glutathione peroxidase
MDQNFYSFEVKKADGSVMKLSELKGKPVVVVNVASKCGFTPQYEGLEQLYKSYHEKGLEMIGFPCNQFGGQEPGSNQEIQSFCKLNYGVTFPVMSKIDVNGDNADPLYKWMKAASPGVLGTEAIKWNFTKFLIDRKGNVVHRYSPQTAPKDLEKDIAKAIAEAP